MTLPDTFDPDYASSSVEFKIKAVSTLDPTITSVTTTTYRILLTPCRLLEMPSQEDDEFIDLLDRDSYPDEIVLGRPQLSLENCDVDDFSEVVTVASMPANQVTRRLVDVDDATGDVTVFPEQQAFTKTTQIIVHRDFFSGQFKLNEEPVTQVVVFFKSIATNALPAPPQSQTAQASTGSESEQEPATSEQETPATEEQTQEGGKPRPP